MEVPVQSFLHNLMSLITTMGVLKVFTVWKNSFFTWIKFNDQRTAGYQTTDVDERGSSLERGVDGRIIINFKDQAGQ